MSTEKGQSLNICKQEIGKAITKFRGSELNYEQEEIFAMQLLMKNDYLLDTAIKNPVSLRTAMYNVAAMGVTLNPQMGLAYLIPRRLQTGALPSIVLDISYKGLLAIATESGTIIRANVELIHQNDGFTYRGPWAMPEVQIDPFSMNRGEVIGGYCLAELDDSRVMCHTMSRADMDKIRDKSEAYKKGYGPWIDWEDQMQLKSVLKRSTKWWPNPSPRLAKVITYLNEENGEGLPALTLVSSSDKSAALPPPPPESDVPEACVNWVAQVIDRAIQSQSFGAAKELILDRIKDPKEKSYGLDKLEKARTSHIQAAS